MSGNGHRRAHIRDMYRLRSGVPVPTYFCFIESELLNVPHMEPLMATSDRDARREAETLMAQHASAVAAHVLLDDRLIATIRREPGPRR